MRDSIGHPRKMNAGPIYKNVDRGFPDRGIEVVIGGTIQEHEMVDVEVKDQVIPVEVGKKIVEERDEKVAKDG